MNSGSRSSRGSSGRDSTKSRSAASVVTCAARSAPATSSGPGILMRGAYPAWRIATPRPGTVAAVSPDRELDVLLYGATGFVGRLTAEYLARTAPEDLRIGLAGRSQDRLAEVRS